MYLYFSEEFDGSGNNHEFTDALINKSISSYFSDKGIEKKVKIDDGLTISRTPQGKPYVDTLPLNFSVSHTGGLWVCIVGKDCKSIGIDIEKKRCIDSKKIADRFFSKEEANYVHKWGKDSFFEIWTMKEAYAKFLGVSIWEVLNKVNLVKNDHIVQKIGDVHFVHIDISPFIKCTCATVGEGEICIKQIL